MTGTELVR